MFFIMQYRKYHLDHTFFDNIDSQEKAYFLGLLFADGCNDTLNGVVSIDLQEGDINILEKFTELIQPLKPIKIYPNYHSKSNRARMVIASRYVSNRLAEIGMVSQKSEKLCSLNDVPKHLMNHFIRGYFDGNGSIGVYGKVQNVEFSICSTKMFLEILQKNLIDECLLSATKFGKRHKNRDSNSCHIKYTGRFSCLKIREYLYKDATVYMKRKYDKFFSIPKTKDKS
jgi:hypothetical protein